MGKRRWFQFRLSTALVMMFVASVLVWANCQPHDIMIRTIYSIKQFEAYPAEGWVRERTVYGWPFVVYSTHSNGEEILFAFGAELPSLWQLKGIVFNSSIGLSTLGIVALLSEWIHRRIERLR